MSKDEKGAAMLPNGAHRETGSGLAVILILVSMLLAFSAALTMTSLAGVRSVNDSGSGMRAFYQADSGAQVGIAQVRASDGTLGQRSFVEKMDRGNASVGITIPALNYYKILSTSSWDKETRTVEVYVKFTGSFALEGAGSLTFSKGTIKEKGGIQVGVDTQATISGMDHDETGALALDQTGAVRGLSTNSLPGGEDFVKVGNGTLEGFPSPTTNKAKGQESILTALYANAKTGADIQLVGSQTLGDAQTGLYGSLLAPKLVYAQLGDNQTLTMTQSFTGYGTLVIEVTDSKNITALNMNSFSTWNGLVMLYFRDKKVNEKEGVIATLQDNAKIVGGLSLFFNTDKSKVDKDTRLIQVSHKASLLYSSKLINTARGTENLTKKSAEVISYRML